MAQQQGPRADHDGDTATLLTLPRGVETSVEHASRPNRAT